MRPDQENDGPRTVRQFVILALVVGAMAAIMFALAR